MNRGSILLVDDSPHDTELALEALRRHHFSNEIVALRDGVEALAYLFRRDEFAGRTDANPVAILLDLKMPRIDGLEVLRQMRADPVLRLIPVIMMTSSREEQDMIASYSLGVNAYVVKPLEFHAFVEAIRLVGGFWAIVNEPPPRSQP